ncbi:MAG: hypothetical protein JXB50_15170 [Spirochaetes bacterium]|nr:hypothetical protein [Spirochaetota bacterium]
MIGNINLSQYYKVVQMTNSLNSFIRQAAVTKAQINASLSYSLVKHPGIGNNIDIFV